MGLTKVTYSMIEGAAINVLDYGADPTGSTASTTAIQAAIDSVKNVGGTVYVPAGTYITAALNVGGGTKNWSFVGESSNITKLVSSNGVGNFIGGNLINSPAFQMSGFSIDCKRAEYPSASGGHAIAIYDCDNVLLTDLKITNYLNSAILVYPSVNAYVTNVAVVDCHCDGNDLANNGFLMLKAKFSGYDRCSAKNLLSTGAPSYGIQFKDDCQYCYISNSSAEKCRAGFGFGQESGVGVKYCTVNNIVATNCYVWGFIAGYCSENQITNYYCDLNLVADSVAMNFTYSDNNYVNMKVKNLSSTSTAVLLQGNGCDSNKVYVSSVDTVVAGGQVLKLNTGTPTKNTVTIAKSNNPEIPSGVGGPMGWFTTTVGYTNGMNMEDVTMYERCTIDAGVIELNNSKTTEVRLLTEGGAASDYLDTITSDGTDGRTITLWTVSNSNEVIVNEIGNIKLSGGTDKTLSNVADLLVLRYNSALSKWCEVSFSDNAA